MRRQNSSNSKARRLSRSWAVVLVLLSSSLAYGAPLQESPVAAVEVRSVSADAQPCLNVRSRPSYRAPLVACLEIGSVVTVTAQSAGWSQVAAADDLSGWVGSRFLVTGANDQDPETALLEPPADESARMAERLATAEGLASSHEAELEAARSAWEAAAAEASDLATSVQELTEERDSLAFQLARAEARVIYLQADLEETRAELMRLKGIPPRLVLPEPEPEPVPVAVAVEPEPEPDQVAETETFALPVDPSFVTLDEVVAAVRAWARAWSDQRIDDYLSFYSASFVPQGGESRESWAARRRERISAPRSIEVELDQISPGVIGQRASVRFVQIYTSDTFSDTVTKTLLLERGEAGTWQIVEERAE